MRTVVFAYSDLGYACLATLLDLGADVAAVFTHAADPNEQRWFRSVHELASGRGLPVFTDEQLDTPAWLDRLRGWEPDFLFSFYYRRLLPPAVLATARRAALNLHGSLLPKYRGRAPTNWVLVHGESETGVTLHHMVARADAGDIVAQRRVPIDDDDTAITLYRKQTAAAEELLREMYPHLCADTAPRRPMDLAAGSYFGGRTPADGRIDWGQSAREIYNLVRAVTHPYPGAFTHWRGRPLYVWAAQVASTAGEPPPAPGTVVALDEGMVVQTGAGLLRALSVQPADGAEQRATEWARDHDVGEGVVLA
ncbi:MAG: formyltransferase [Candidatus Binatia bacterium]